MRLLSSICGIILLVAWCAPPAEAQGKNKNKIAGNPKQQARQAEKQQNRGPVPTEQVERLLNMSPEERERALSSLPPGRRAQIEKRIDNLQSMPLKQRERQLDMAKRLESLPQDRQPVVRKEIQDIARMTFRERRERLHSDEFNQSYSPEEQQLMRDRFPNAAR